jgi:hypothetical protein
MRKLISLRLKTNKLYKISRDCHFDAFLYLSKHRMELRKEQIRTCLLTQVLWL